MTIDPAVQQMFQDFDESYAKATADQGDGNLGKWPKNEQSPEAEEVEDIFHVTGVTVESTDIRYKADRDDQDYKFTPGISVQFHYARTADQQDEGRYEGCTNWKGKHLDIPAKLSVLPKDYWQPRYQKAINKLRGHVEGLGIEGGDSVPDAINGIIDLFKKADDSGVPIYARVKFIDRSWEDKRSGEIRNYSQDHILELHGSID